MPTALPEMPSCDSTKHHLVVVAVIALVGEIVVVVVDFAAFVVTTDVAPSTHNTTRRAPSIPSSACWFGAVAVAVPQKECVIDGKIRPRHSVRGMSSNFPERPERRRRNTSSCDWPRWI